MMAEKNIMLDKGEKVARKSAIITIILTILKGVVGFISGSVALMADALHSFADIFSSLAVYVGLKLAKKKPTEQFPYGYYKAETFASLIVSLIIILSGIEILRESIDNLFNPTTVTSVMFVLLTSAISAITSFFAAKYKENAGMEINSQALISEGKHSMIDVYVSIFVLIGVLFSYLGFPWMEALAGLAVSLLIIKIGLWQGKDAVLVLMDISLRPELVRKIEETAKNVQGVRGIHDLKVRRSGMFVFGEMRIKTAETLTVYKANRIFEEIEMKVKENVGGIDSLTIHIEPAKKDKFRVAIPIHEDEGFESRPIMHFGRSPYFILIDVETGKPKHWIVKENPAFKIERKSGATAADFLVKQKVDILLIKEIMDVPFHILRDNFIEIYKLPPGGIKKALDLLIKDMLEIITEPSHNSKNMHY
jgi:cation diffusion facilitator family transporter